MPDKQAPSHSAANDPSVSKILLEVVEHTHTQPPAAGRHMGLGGPSLAGRDSGLTPDSSTIENREMEKPLHDAGASGETKKSIEGVFWIDILSISRFWGFVKGVRLCGSRF